MQIDEAKFITLGNAKQFVIIRGENQKNPLLLLLHGGTTETAHFVKFNKALEKYFTLVYWIKEAKENLTQKRVANPSQNLNSTYKILMSSHKF